MIFIKNKHVKPGVFASKPVNKGQLYNIDLNEFISFQFNPEALEWARTFKWGEHNWVGNTRGGDVQFINLEPRLIDIDLLFMAEPRAPQIEYKSDFKIIDANGLVDFNAIKATIEKWEKPLPGIRRPSRVGILMGDNVFEGVLKSYTMRINEFFKDLSPKEGILMLEFREWQLI
jgi:hypothetical protein